MNFALDTIAIDALPGEDVSWDSGAQSVCVLDPAACEVMIEAPSIAEEVMIEAPSISETVVSVSSSPRIEVQPVSDNGLDAVSAIMVLISMILSLLAR